MEAGCRVLAEQSTADRPLDGTGVADTRLRTKRHLKGEPVRGSAVGPTSVPTRSVMGKEGMKGFHLVARCTNVAIIISYRTWPAKGRDSGENGAQIFLASSLAGIAAAVDLAHSNVALQQYRNCKWHIAAGLVAAECSWLAVLTPGRPSTRRC